RLHLQVDLRNALENGEFQLYYQPQSDLASGKMIGVEALLRWHHPTLGMVSPSHFIPLAEECGLIVPIGQWVLEEACRQGAQWQKSGMPPLVVAVNISALQFSRGDLVEIIERALRDSGFPARQLEIEITESLLMRNLDGTRETIQRLKKLGIQFAIDDFGTGYSSLSSLKTMKVNKLKIDQSFVRDIGHDADDLAIVRAIIQLGKTLQLRVIAEGVETLEQLDILRKHGCDEVQGYYFGQPQPPENLQALLMTGKG
ncbi:MAG: EAL domain-containing protein, partial [Azonexus sp.]|nr:EAL domain-containing protein [Azonexus sp.]